MVILDRTQIEELIDLKVAGAAIEAAYISASRGAVTLPPVGHIMFPEASADCHIKFGHVKGDPSFTVLPNPLRLASRLENYLVKVVGDPGIEPGVRLREGVTVPCHTLRPVAHWRGDYLWVGDGSTTKSGDLA